jgi:hypothetical protein
MLVMGYRGTPDWAKIRASFKRCTTMNDTDIQKIVKNIKEGKSEIIPNDFVLYEELKDFGILIK